MPRNLPGRADAPWPRRATLALAFVYAAVYGWVCWIKYRYYLYGDFDFAIFAQAMERMLHGSLYSSIRGMMWLGDHSSLILFPLLPVYAVFRHPATLLVVQTVALALGALPVFAIARRELGSAWTAFAFATLYLLHPAIGYTNLFEFHPEALATPALLFTFRYLLEGRFARTIVAATLALMCREDVALVVLPMALWALWIRRRDGVRFAVALAALGVASLALSFAVLKPAFNHGEAGYAGMYTAWGGNLREVFVHLVRHPAAAAVALVSTPNDAAATALKQQYFVLMLAPLLFLPLLSPPALALAIPVLLEHFLSWRPPQHTIVYQYTALVTPVLVVAAILGARNAAARLGRDEAVPVLAGVAFGASLVCNGLYGPLAGAGRIAGVTPPQRVAPNVADRTMKPFRDRMLAELPRDGGVVAGFELLPHLARRGDVHAAHHVFGGRYTFSEQPYPLPRGISALVADATDEHLLNYVTPAAAARLREMIAVNGLRCADAAGDLLLLASGRRDTITLVAPETAPAGTMVAVTFDGTLRYLGADPIADRAHPGGWVELRTHWRRLAETDRLYYMVLGLFDAAGHTVLQRVRPLGYAVDPAGAWPIGRAMVEHYRLVLPYVLPAGRYALAATLSSSSGTENTYAVPDDAAVRAAGGFVTLGTIDVAP